MDNILFICLLNQNRSVTAAKVYKKILNKQHKLAEVKTAGIDPYSKKVVDKELISWADHIFVMEPYMASQILTMDKTAKRRITILNIPDIFNADDPQLAAILEQKLINM
ncbi:MAG: hypothetical protein ABIG95_03750 [Candidatus Woesearchaeota archaeon]